MVQQPTDPILRVLGDPEPLMPTRPLEVHAMRKHFATAVIGLGAALGITGCGDFLTGPKLSDNPNRPIAATNANLLVASMALIELGITSLADAGEDERHLFLFHVLTDFTVLLALAALALGVDSNDNPFEVNA